MTRAGRRPDAGHDRGQAAAAFWRRQVVLAGVTALVVLTSSLLVARAIDRSGHHVALRPGVDGSITAVALPAESSGAAMWAATAAVLAVAGLVVVLVAHTVRVARFAAAGAALHRKEP